MPLYDYKCHKCGEVFEVRQKFADEPLKVHDKCGGEVHRMLSAPALQFKGTGWYVTDYGKGGKLPAGSNGKSESKSESKTESKAESKSETKSESKKSESKSDNKPAPASSEK
jgi:putative FmdB family regulatory protein